MLCLQKDYVALKSDTFSTNIQFVVLASFVYTFFFSRCGNSVLFCTAFCILNKDFPLLCGITYVNVCHVMNQI